MSADVVMQQSISMGDLDDALALSEKNSDAATSQLKQIANSAENNEDAVKVKEQALHGLAQIFAKHNRSAELRQLFVDMRPFFASLPKARTAKIVRSLVSAVSKAQAPLNTQAELLQESIQWCISEKRTFLKHRLQCRLATVFLRMEKFKDALAVMTSVVREVKKLDDKLLLVEIFLIESRIHLALQNAPKAKGALTSARSSANSIYCPPKLQAQIDMQAGTLCTVEGDYKTGFSYFYEAFEGYNTVDKPQQAVRALKHMLLCKIMTNQSEDVYSIITGKSGIKYAGPEVEAMRAVAEAHKKRDVHMFEDVFNKFKTQLADDPSIAIHLSELKANLLQQNLLRLLEPYSRVQVQHVAKLIKLPVELVEARLSEMILDGKLGGILDQGSGDLILFDESQEDKTYSCAIGTIKELSGSVDRLYGKATTLATSAK